VCQIPRVTCCGFPLWEREGTHPRNGREAGRTVTSSPRWTHQREKVQSHIADTWPSWPGPRGPSKHESDRGRQRHREAERWRQGDRERNGERRPDCGAVCTRGHTSSVTSQTPCCDYSTDDKKAAVRGQGLSLMLSGKCPKLEMEKCGQRAQLWRQAGGSVLGIRGSPWAPAVGISVLTSENLFPL
jgi:hypothetical protein